MSGLRLKRFPLQRKGAAVADEVDGGVGFYEDDVRVGGGCCCSVDEMYRIGWAVVPYGVVMFLCVFTALLVWVMVAVMPNVVTTASNAAKTSAAVSTRADQYLNQTDALMVYLNPTDVQRFAEMLMKTGTAGLPIVGAALSEMASRAGTVINWTAAAVAVGEIIDLTASAATQTRERGLTITLLQPSPTPAPTAAAAAAPLRP